MNRTEIENKVYLTLIEAKKFKRCRITLQFVMPGVRSAATAAALLPMVMTRGYADCPDVTELSIKLAKLYGAALNAYTATSGGNRIISFSITGIKDEYAIEGESLTKEYLDILLGTVFNPKVKDGGFDEQDLKIEKEKLKEMILSEINDKRGYCLRQARRKFFGDSPAGIERYGYLDEVDRITPQALYDEYQNMLKTAKLEVVVLGANGETVKNAVCEKISQTERKPEHLNGVLAMPHRQTEEFAEPVNAVQGKLCMVFTTGENISAEDLSKMRMATALFGGTPTSRLFMNVREKQSLCYYCAAGFVYTTGTLTVDSGVEHSNAQKTKNAVLAELDKLKNAEITDEEIEDTRKSIQNSLLSVGDSISGLESWYLSEISRGTDFTPDEVSRQLDAVTAQDIKDMLSKFSLSVVYILTQEGEKVEQ